MKQLQKTMMLGLFALTFSFILADLPVKAASCVEKMCNYSSSNSTFSADMTGDNKKDVIKLKMTKDEECGFIQKLRIYVNGTKALTLKNKDSYYSVTATYIHMSRSKNFLQITGRGDNDYATFNSIYRYDAKTKKLVKVLDLTSNYLLTDGEVIRATGKKIVIRHSYQPSETGWLHWKYSYVYKNKKFKRISDTASVKTALGDFAMKDGYEKYFAKNQFVAARSLRFYSSVKMNKTAFVTKKGDILTLKKVKISGNKMYLQFQKGSKTGWREVNKRSYIDKPFFYGVNERLAG
ncbi:MAG: hypothetical protein PUH88_02275 [Lachnospiraceae bacterium]|nr:hypothetical protein [Lachnospiraceae bacterium]